MRVLDNLDTIAYNNKKEVRYGRSDKGLCGGCYGL